MIAYCIDCRALVLRLAMERHQAMLAMEITATQSSPMVNHTTSLDTLEQGVY